MPDTEPRMWATPEREHRELPVWVGNYCDTFVGLWVGYGRDLEYDPPTALEPVKDHEGDFRSVYWPAVHLEFETTGTIYTLNLRKEVAKELYERLHLLFGSSDG